MGQIVCDEYLDTKFDVYGFEDGNEIIDFDKELLSISDMLSNINYDIKSKKWFCTKGKLIKNAKMFLNNYFDLHDVMFIPKVVANNIFIALDFGLVDSYMLSEQLSNISKLISPCDIPIKYYDDTFTQQSVLLGIPYYNLVNINKKNSKTIIPEYIHELGHTQLDSQRGVIINYHNREVISIFLEKLSALMLDDKGTLLRNIQLCRYRDLLDCFKFLNERENGEVMRKLEASVYVVSALKAEMLFEIYLNGDNKFRERLLQCIQNIFDGKETVEDFLERYDVSDENSKDKNILKRQLKI